VVLMGMMAVGKTTVGRALATRLDVDYADNDDELRVEAGVDAATFAQQHGVEALHALEHDILSRAVERVDRAVIGAPGSVALDAAAPQVLEGQWVVWLRASVETLAARVRHDPARPLIGSDVEGTLRRLIREREPGFARLASQTIDVDRLQVEEIVGRVVEALPTG
jgi:shikimate kinase